MRKIQGEINGTGKEEENCKREILHWWVGMGLSAMVLAGNMDSSSRVTGKKAAYVGTEVGWWEDVGTVG